jgi:hypothetical protein
MKGIHNLIQKGLNNTCKPRHGSTIVAMLVLFSHFIACHCSKNPSSGSHSGRGTGNSTSSGSISTGNPGGGGNILSNPIDITADMLKPLANEPFSKAVKVRLEQYLTPGSGIDVDQQYANGSTMLEDLAYCMSSYKLSTKKQSEKEVKMQQAMIDIANALLN